MDLQPQVLESDGLPGLTRQFAFLFDLETKAVQGLLALAADPAAAPWQQTQLPGMQRASFAGGTRVADADCGLVRILPGVRLPEHRHLGDEWAIVLQGRITETCGRRFDVGDIAFSPAGSRHALEVEGEVAVVLALATFGGIEFLR